MLRPRHLGYMQQPLYSRIYLYKSAIIGYYNNFAANFITNFYSLFKRIPRMRSKLFKAKSNTFLAVVEIKDYNLYLFVKLNYLFRMINTSPRQIGDVNKPINTAEVNKHTISCDIFNSTFEHLALFELRNNFGFLLLKLTFDKRFMRNNNVFKFMIDLYNLEFHHFININIIIAYGLHVNLRTWEKSLNTENIHNQPALSPAFHIAIDNLFGFKCLIYTFPRFQ
jgi:hypothetical protein